MENNILTRKVIIIKRIYFALFILWAIGTLYNFYAHSKIGEMLEGFICVILYIVIYLGLRYRKDWVIHLVLITSAFSCFWFGIRILIPSEDITALISKFLIVFLLFFFGYQILFFRKPEVRKFFGVKGKEIF